MAAGPYNYSYIFKYIIIGDMGVGKSCLLHQFTEKKCKSGCANCTYVIVRFPQALIRCVMKYITKSVLCHADVRGHRGCIPFSGFRLANLSHLSVYQPPLTKKPGHSFLDGRGIVQVWLCSVPILLYPSSCWFSVELCAAIIMPGDNPPRLYQWSLLPDPQRIKYLRDSNEHSILRQPPIVTGESSV